MDGRIMCCGIISSCQSAATSEIVKCLLVASLTHVSMQRYSKLPDLYLYLYFFVSIFDMIIKFFAPFLVLPMLEHFDLALYPVIIDICYQSNCIHQLQTVFNTFFTVHFSFLATKFCFIPHLFIIVFVHLFTVV